MRQHHGAPGAWPEATQSRSALTRQQRQVRGIDERVDMHDTELPFPFGGSPIPATLQVLLREFDEQTGLARITAQSIPDPVQLNKAMGEWMIRMARSQGQPAPEASQIPELYVQDTTDFLYDRKMGLPREVTSEKFITVAGGASIRIDRRSYRIIPLQ